MEFRSTDCASAIVFSACNNDGGNVATTTSGSLKASYCWLCSWLIMGCKG
jgi:hypothetical protein